MSDWVEDVKAFMDKFGQEREISLVSARNNILRNKLLMEEVMELQSAVLDNDFIEVADALADIIYITIGTALTLGIDLRPVWDEVHRSNMAKYGGSIREDGKILKPIGWEPPNIAEALKLGKL